MAASKLPVETLDLLLLIKLFCFLLFFIFYFTLSDCKKINISPPSGQIFTSSFVPVSRLTALLPATHLYSRLSFFFFLWIIIRDGYIYYNEGLCFLEALSRGVVSSCWWMLANRRCQTQCSLSFITSLKDVPLGILTRPLPPLHSLRKSLVVLQQLCSDIRWWRERTPGYVGLPTGQIDVWFICICETKWLKRQIGLHY